MHFLKNYTVRLFSLDLEHFVFFYTQKFSQEEIAIDMEVNQ